MARFSTAAPGLSTSAAALRYEWNCLWDIPPLRHLLLPGNQGLGFCFCAWVSGFGKGLVL